MKRVIILLLLFSLALVFAPRILAKRPSRKGILGYAGRYFRDPSSPGYASYDRDMSMYVAQRIKVRYDVDLDHTVYSAFDLLEIEALLKCKKADESVESLLERFHR